MLLGELLERPTSAGRLAAGLPLEDGRLTPALAVRAAARAGLAARLVRRPLERISDLTLPCILLLEGREACVLVARAGGRAIVALPETGGRSELALADLAARYSGHALFARPELRLDHQAREARRQPRGSWFWGTLAQAWPIYGEVVLAAVLINLFALAAPLFIMNVYDRVVPNHAIETLWVLAVGVLTVFLFDFLLRNLRGYFVDSAGRMADVKLASRIFEQVLGLRMAARPASAGAFANNLREFESLRDFLTSATLVALVDLPFVLLFIAVVWLLGGPVALVPAIAVPLVIGVGLLLQLPLNAVIRRSFHDAAQKHGVLVESISGLETIKSLGAEGRTQRRWERHVGVTAGSAMRARFLASLGVNFSTAGAEPGHGRGGDLRGLPDRRRRDDGRRAGGLHHHHRPRHGAARPGRRHPDPLPSGARRVRRARSGDGPAQRAPGGRPLPASAAGPGRDRLPERQLPLSGRAAGGAGAGVVRDRGRASGSA